MINTVMKEIPSFLDKPPAEIDKICWKRAYATYLIVNDKTPEDFANDPINLIELLPLFRSLDRKWLQVEPEMMKTTHTIVHRLKIVLERFKRYPKQVYDLMYDIRQQQEASADVDQTINPDRTASEKSGDEQEKEEPTLLGLVNAPSTLENQEEEVKVEKEGENPLKQAAEHEQTQAQNLQQEQGDVQVPKDDASILGQRPRTEFEVNESDLSRYGTEVIEFLTAGKEKNKARKARDETEVNYQKAKAYFKAVRTKFNAAFESSAENKD